LEHEKWSAIDLLGLAEAEDREKRKRLSGLEGDGQCDAVIAAGTGHGAGDISASGNKIRVKKKEAGVWMRCPKGGKRCGYGFCFGGFRGGIGVDIG